MVERSDDVPVAESGHGPTDRNAQPALIVFSLVVAGAAALYFVMGRHQWFYFDEWDFLAGRSARSLNDVFRPHNEHWTTLPILVYRALWWAVGLRSYRPYQAFTIALHLTVGVLLRVVMRRAGVSAWIATAAASLFVLLGSGRQDIFWAFQMGYVGSIAFGLVHLLLAVHDGPVDRRDYFGLAAGLAGLMCSGVAVTMVVVVGLAVLLTRGWRLAALHTLPLGAVYIVWWLIVGHEGYTNRAANLHQALSFVWNGTSATFAGLGQLPGVGVALGAVLVVGLVLAVRSDPKGLHGRLAMPGALLVGAAVFLSISAIGRPGLVFIGGSRYTHVVAALTIPAVALAADALVRRWRLFLPVALLVLLIGVPGNIGALWVRNRFEEGNRLVLTLPRVPAATEVPRDTRFDPVTSYDVTIGWLLDGVASGRVPPPASGTTGRSAIIQRLTRAVATLSLSLQQVRSRAPQSGCRDLLAPAVRRLERGERLSFRGGQLRVTLPGDPTYTAFDPAHGQTLLVRAGLTVSLQSIDPTHPAAICS